MRLTLLLLILCTFVYSPATTQDSLTVNDTTTIQNIPGDQEVDEEFNMVLFGLFFGAMAVTIAVAILASIVVVVAILFVLTLIGAGILSAAAVRGWYAKSFGAGLRTATYLTGVICGAAGGAAIAWGAQLIWHWSTSNGTVWLTGISGGLLGGTIAAAFAIWLTRKMWTALIQKMRKNPSA